MSVLLASCIILSLAACGNTPAQVNQVDEDETEAATTTAADSKPASDDSAPSGSTTEAGEGGTAAPATDAEPAAKEEWTVDYDSKTVYAGSAKTNVASAESGSLDYSIYAGEPGKDYTDPKVYTFNDYFANMTNMKWSTHTWEENKDTYVLDLISKGFYEFELNSTKDGWL